MLCLILLLVFVGCDVHEFPKDDSTRVPFVLHLDFNTEMPLYKEVYYTRADEVMEIADPHNIRYIINVYRTDNKRNDNRVADTTYIFSKSDISDLNYTAYLQLPEGEYHVAVADGKCPAAAQGLLKGSAKVAAQSAMVLYL